MKEREPSNMHTLILREKNDNAGIDEKKTSHSHNYIHPERHWEKF